MCICCVCVGPDLNVFVSSEYFSALFASGSVQKEASVVLHFDDQSGVFPDVLRFLYAGSVQIKVRTA